MATGPAKEVNDWVAVEPDPEDWETVSGAVPSAAPKPKSLSGFASNVAKSAGDFVGGIATAAMSPRQTLSNLSDVAQGAVVRGAQAVGVKDGWTPDAESRGQKFDALVGSYKQRYGSPSAAAETLYSDPVGAAADLSMIAGGAGGVLKAAGMGKAAQKANAISQATNPLVAVPRAISKAVPKGLKEKAAHRMYQGALKPPPGSFKREEVAAMVDKGLVEGIPVSSKGLGTVRNRIDAIDDQVAGMIKEGAEAGKTVDPTKVASYTKRAEEAFTTVDPADINPIHGVRDRFLEKQSVKAPYTKVKPATEEGLTGYVPIGKGETSIPKPIPIDEAQALKRNTYRDIRESYGEQSSAVREAKKDLARGLKDGVYAHYPELKALGSSEKVLVDLETALERFANRHGNRDLIGLGGPAKILTGATAGGAGGAMGALAAALEIPFVKSKLAIALKKSASKPSGGPARVRQGMNITSGLQAPRPIEEEQQ